VPDPSVSPTLPPWWLDEALAAEGDAPEAPALEGETRVDVAVIGSGYCGMTAALGLARAGARVAVLDNDALGAGASTRNGGMVSGTVKLDWQHLARRHGAARAAALLDGARASFEFVEDLIAREGSLSDRRKVELKLTSRGRQLLAKLAAMHRRELQRTGPILRRFFAELSRPPG